MSLWKWFFGVIGGIVISLSLYWALAYIFLDLDVVAFHYYDNTSNQNFVDLTFRGGSNTLTNLDGAAELSCPGSFSFLQEPLFGEQEGVEDCKVTNTGFPILTFSCRNIYPHGGLSIVSKTASLPDNCSVKLNYRVDLSGPLFRIPRQSTLYEISLPTQSMVQTYVKQQVEQPTINLTFEIAQIRRSFHNGGRVIMYTQIISNLTGTYKLTAEWYNSSNISQLTYVRNSSFSDELNLTPFLVKSYFHWNGVHTQNSSEVGFRLVLRKGTEYFERFAVMNLTVNDSLLPFLWDDHRINTSNKVITMKAIETSIASGSEELPQSMALLNLTRSVIAVPPEYESLLYYDSTEVDSITAFNKGEGTSSEYSDIYVTLLRSVGIPARTLSHLNENGLYYYYAEVFIDGLGWLPVDVMNYSSNLGDCVVNCTQVVVHDISLI